MLAIVIAPDTEEREFLTYSLRQIGLTVTNVAHVDTAVSRLSRSKSCGAIWQIALTIYQIVLRQTSDSFRSTETN